MTDLSNIAALASAHAGGPHATSALYKGTEAEVEFRKMVEKSDGYYFPARLGGFEKRGRHGVAVRVTPDFDRGIYSIDVPVNLTIKGDRGPELLARCKSHEGFALKIGQFWTEGDVAWGEGSQIHFGVEKFIGDGDFDRDVSNFERAAHGFLEALTKINDGERDFGPSGESARDDFEAFLASMADD